jgi:hypothetical protein
MGDDPPPAHFSDSIGDGPKIPVNPPPALRPRPQPKWNSLQLASSIRLIHISSARYMTWDFCACTFDNSFLVPPMLPISRSRGPVHVYYPPPRPPM